MVVVVVVVMVVCSIYIYSKHALLYLLHTKHLTKTPLYSTSTPPYYYTDTVEDVKRKIKKAFCPPEVVEKNPIMDYAKNIIFGYYGKMAVNSQTVRGCRIGVLLEFPLDLFGFY